MGISQREQKPQHNTEVVAGSLAYLFTELGSIYVEVKISMDKIRANCAFMNQYQARTGS